MARRDVRGLALLLFIGLAGFTAWTLLDGDFGFMDREAGTELSLAEEHDAAVRSLDHVAEDALDNAQEAEALAAELEEAALRAERSAGEVIILSGDNDAAAPSAEAAEIAADDAAAAAALMQRYADRMEARFRRTEGLANEAEEIAEMVEAVEETQAEARRAALRAEQAREEMRALENGDRAQAGFSPLPSERPEPGEIVILGDDDTIDVVEEAEREDDAEVQRRLDEIFPDEVLGDEDETPYGERG